MRRVAVLLFLSASGCMGVMGYSTLEQVSQAAREYNNDVRWGRLDQAAKHVPKSEREGFIDRLSGLDGELEIAEYELTHFEIDSKKQSADARVEYTWSLRSVGLVRKTTASQHWERRLEGWVVTTEKRVLGAPLALCAETPAANRRAGL